MADELEQLERERELINEKLARKLDEMGRRLASARRLYNEMAAEPIAFLEAAFPLIADQERFVMLVLWQQDLAERLSSLRGHDKEDDPALRARMRDLEEEQRQIRDALARLLDDVQEHIDKLPEKPELKELRETAQEFVGKVRKSGASEAMAAAEAALAEFAGTRGYEKAKEAADILAKFLGECQGCKGGACNGMRLVFRPKLCKSMDDTLGQLLAGLGMGNGMGTGNGMGGQGIGMGGGMGGVGLFGGLPEMMGLEKSGQGRANNVGGAAGYRAAPGGENSDERAGDNGAAGQAGGAGEGAAPARYRRQVGQYFQRIAEETGQSPR
jgi:hypothetical protein